MKPTHDTPVYLSVADAVERLYGGRAPGTPVPSENELARQHAVSRLTARAALDELERRYVVQRTKGRGTFVARRIDYQIGPHIPPSFSATVRRAGAVPRLETERLRLRVAPARVASTLELERSARAFFLARRRYVDELFASYAESWIASDLVPDLAESLPADGSLQEAFERAGLAPERLSTRAEFVVAPSAIAERLAVDGRPLVVKLEGSTFSRRARRPLQVTTSWLRADVFRIVFDIGGPS